MESDIKPLKIEPVSSNQILLTGMTNIKMDIYDHPPPGKFEIIVDFPRQKDRTRILIDQDGTVQVGNAPNEFTTVHVGEELLEELADLEHGQWMNWSQALFIELQEHQQALLTAHGRYENLPADVPHHPRDIILYNKTDDRISRWKRLWKPYAELTEDEKQSDREYATNVIEVLKKHGLVKKGNA